MKKYTSKWQDAWADKYPGVRKSPKGESFALCSICQDDFSVSHGGRNDVEKHIAGKKHKAKVVDAKRCGVQAKLTNMRFQPGPEFCS